jgi:hypothetical protein
MWTKLWVGLVGLAAFASAGRAANLSYNFTTLVADGQGSVNATASSLAYTQSGITLTVTGKSGPPNSAQNVVQTSGVGLGVSDQTIDNKEFLDLTFSSAVTLNTISFTNFTAGPGNSGANSDVELLSPTTGMIFSGVIPGNSPSTIDLGPAGLNIPLASRAGLVFEFSTLQGNDSYSLGGLTASFSTDTPPPSGVPLPTSAYAGLALLTALAVSRKVRHAFA